MKKKKFSLIALSLGVLLAFPVIGCGGEEAPPSQEEAPPSQQECASNADCADPALPICDEGVCVANCPDGKYNMGGTCYAEGDECDSDDETLSYGICGMRKAVYCESQVIQVDNCRGACGVDSTAGGMRCLF